MHRDPHQQRQSTPPLAAIAGPLTADAVAGPEWAAWYALTPLERWEASQRLWSEYIALGGSLDPEVDTQSPFWSDEDLRQFAQAQVTSRDALQRIEGRSNDRPTE